MFAGRPSAPGNKLLNLLAAHATGWMDEAVSMRPELPEILTFNLFRTTRSPR